MELEQKVQVLEGVLAAVVNSALNADRLPPAVVRLALADALHKVQELERQAAERLEAEKRRQDEAARKAATASETQASAAPPAAGETKEAWNDGEQNKAG